MINSLTLHEINTQVHQSGSRYSVEDIYYMSLGDFQRELENMAGGGASPSVVSTELPVAENPASIDSSPKVQVQSFRPASTRKPHQNKGLPVVSWGKLCLGVVFLVASCCTVYYAQDMLTSMFIQTPMVHTTQDDSDVSVSPVLGSPLVVEETELVTSESILDGDELDEIQSLQEKPVMPVTLSVEDVQTEISVSTIKPHYGFFASMDMKKLIQERLIEDRRKKYVAEQAILDEMDDKRLEPVSMSIPERNTRDFVSQKVTRF